MFFSKLECGKIIFDFLIVEYLKSQWKNVKENFKRCLDKRNRMTRSGAASHTLPKCKYFENLLFINDKILNQETCSNIVLPNEPLSSPLSSQSSSSLSSPQSCQPLSLSQAIPELKSSEQKKRQAEEDTAVKQNTEKCQAKRKKEMSSNIDLLTLKYLENLSGDFKTEESKEEVDSNMLFFKSLVPSMKNMTKHNNRKARLKIQEIVFDLEASDNE